MATCVVCQTAATVYCENDKAFLCGDCDHKIHTASVVAARHTRFRLCELCNSMAATVYCRNDKVHLCDDCDAEVHQNNPLSATHSIVPAQPLGAEQSQPAPTLASGCNHPHHHHASKEEGGGCVAEAHSETAKVAALCPDADAVTTTSHGHNSDAVVPQLVVMGEEHGDEAAFLSLPTQQQQQQQQDDNAPYGGKGAGDVMDAKPWAKDAFDALELDGGWLDRLEMGFDFSDILDNHPAAQGGAASDDAGLVPTLAPSAAFPSDSFPGVVSEGGSSSLKRSATFDLDDFMPSLKVPFSGPPSSPPSSYHFDFSLPNDNDLPETSSQAPQEEAIAAAAPVAVPLVPRAVLASAEVTSPAVAAAHMSAHAAAAAGAAMTHPVLTREQRVQRYREKRSRRNFEKTIRYASRKAYAEVRPRIKGRFARKEEVLAWKAANPGLAVPEILG